MLDLTPLRNGPINFTESSHISSVIKVEAPKSRLSQGKSQGRRKSSNWPERLGSPSNSLGAEEIVEEDDGIFSSFELLK